MTSFTSGKETVSLAKVVPLFVTNLLDGLTVPLYGDGGNIRDWLHVADHCAGIALVLAKGRTGEVYHIGGGTELTNRDLTDRLTMVRASLDPLRKEIERRIASLEALAAS